jgi:outer membrane usher protein FimD/PapC
MRHFRLVLFGALLVSVFPAFSDKRQFDVAALAQLGYSPDIADFFEEMRFLPGIHTVTVEVNAAQTYALDVKFDDNGQLCVDEAFFDALKLKPLPLLETCNTPAALWAGAAVKLFPGTFRIELLLPELAFDPLQISGEQYGGHALTLNYDLYGQRFASHNSQQQSLQGTLMPGINVGNWVIRNRSQFSSTASQHLQIYETSAVRAMPSLKARTEIGQFGAKNTLFSGLPLTGIQLMSDQNQVDGRLLVPVTGIADSQASVEVRQRGRTVYRTLVPPGPFSLDNLGQTVSGVEVEVEVTESDGRKKIQTLVPQRMVGNTGSLPHYQLGLGRYRSYRQSTPKSAPALLLMGERKILLRQESDTVIGGILSPNYHTVSARHDYANLSGGVLYSRGHQQQGLQLDTQLRFTPSQQTALALTSMYRTLGFQGGDEGLSNTDGEAGNKLRMALGASLSLSYPGWGALVYSASLNHYYQRKSGLTHALSTSRPIGTGTLALTLQASANEPLALFAYMSWPLGKHRVSARMQGGGNREMASGVSLQGQFSDQWGYSLDTAHSGNNTQLSGSSQLTTPYNQMMAGMSQNNNGNQSFNASVSGALAYANRTWLLSSSKVGDTFAVVDMGGASGIKLQASGGGNIITDYAGHALLPSISPYQDESIQIDTQALPLNLRLSSTRGSIKLAHGTVGSQHFRVTEVRQLLLTIKAAEGAAMPVGASVYDDNSKFLGTLIGEGNLMLVNEDIGKTLQIRPINMQACKVEYSIPEAFNPKVLYEEATAVCVPL